MENNIHWHDDEPSLTMKHFIAKDYTSGPDKVFESEDKYNLWYISKKVFAINLNQKLVH